MKGVCKKIILLVVVFAFAFVVGCGDSDKDKNKDVSQGANINQGVSADEMNVKQWMDSLILGGKKIGMPCKAGDLPASVTLGEGTLIPGYGGVCDLYYMEEKIGTAHFDYIETDSVKTVNMNTGYEDEIITSIGFTEYNYFEFAQLKFSSDHTMSDVIGNLGEPDTKEENYAMYGHSESGKRYELQLHWSEDDKLVKCTFLVKDGE